MYAFYLAVIILAIFQFQNCAESNLTLSNQTSNATSDQKLAFQQILTQAPGGLPITTKTFNTSGGDLLILVSGSGFRTTASSAGPIGMAVSLDSREIGTVNGFTNEPNSHKSFSSSAIVVKNVSQGSHSISLKNIYETATNTEDFFNVTVIEVPTNSEFATETLLKQVHGPLPLASPSFSANGGDILVMVSGTAYHYRIGPVSIATHFGGFSLGSLTFFAGEPNSHKSLGSKGMVASNVVKGSHQISLSASDTLTDANDVFDVSILQVPKTVKLTSLPDLKGPLPALSTFATSGGKLLILLSGSSYNTANGGVISTSIAINGKQIGSLKVYTNEGLLHRLFIPEAIVIENLPAGSHTISLTNGDNTATNINDSFNITILESN